MWHNTTIECVNKHGYTRNTHTFLSHTHWSKQAVIVNLWSAVSCRSRPGPFFRSNSICDLLILSAVLSAKGRKHLSVHLCASSTAGAEVFCCICSRRGDLVSETHSLKLKYQKKKNLSFPIYPSQSISDLYVGLALYFYYRPCPHSTQALTDSLRSLRTSSRTWQLRQAFLPSVFPHLSSSTESGMAGCSASNLFYWTNPSCRLQSVRGHVQNLRNLEICTLKYHTISSGCELHC